MPSVAPFSRMNWLRETGIMKLLFMKINYYLFMKFYYFDCNIKKTNALRGTVFTNELAA